MLSRPKIVEVTHLMEGWTNGWINGRMGGWMEGRTDGQTDLGTCYDHLHVGLWTDLRSYCHSTLANDWV